MEERTCLYCKNCVEDEVHVLTECPLYNDIRGNYFKQLQTQYSICCLSKVEILRIILASQDEYTAICSAKTCSEILCARRKFVYNQPPP